MIIGPADTLYEGGFLRAELIFPSVSIVEGAYTCVALSTVIFEYSFADLAMALSICAYLTHLQEYPLLPPELKFITPMWHPNGTSLSWLELVGIRKRPLTVTISDCVVVWHSLCRWQIMHLHFGKLTAQGLDQIYSERTDRSQRLSALTVLRSSACTRTRSMGLRGRWREVAACAYSRVYCKFSAAE